MDSPRTSTARTRTSVEPAHTPRSKNGLRNGAESYENIERTGNPFPTQCRGGACSIPRTVFEPFWAVVMGRILSVVSRSRGGWSRSGPAPERQVRHAAKNTGGEGGPTQRGRPEGSEAEERVEREDAGTREGERCGTDAIEERNLDSVRRREEAVRQVNADRGHDHDREHQGRADGAEEAQRHEKAAPDSADRGGRRKKAPRAEPERFEHHADGGKPVAAEPSEELL